MDFSFCLDDECFVSALRQVKDGENGSLEALVDLISSISDKNKAEIFISNDCLSHQVNGETACDFFYGAMGDLFGEDLTRELQISLDRHSEFDPSDLFTEDYDFDVDGASCSYLFLRRNGYGGLISVDDATGFSWWDENRMTLVDNEVKIRGHYRKVIDYDYSVSLLQDVSEVAFDNIFFNIPLKNLSKLGVCHVLHKEAILSHFGYLNDYAQSEYLDSPDQFIAKAASKGVTLSPESPQTHKDSKAMDQRTFQIGGNNVLCEWHTKITPTEGRIHFHFGRNLPKEVNDTTSGKLIVGAFVDHFK